MLPFLSPTVRLHETPPMDNITAHLPSWGEVFALLLAASFGLWAWVLKTFGNRHIESMDSLTDELREMRRDINGVLVRVAVLESKEHHDQSH